VRTVIDFYIVKIIGYLFIAAILVFAFLGARSLLLNKSKKSKDSQSS